MRNRDIMWLVISTIESYSDRIGYKSETQNILYRGMTIWQIVVIKQWKIELEGLVIK